MPLVSEKNAASGLTAEQSGRAKEEWLKPRNVT